MRALKVLVVVMGVLIVAGTVTLVTLLVQRVGGVGAGTATADVALRQPAGSRIAGVAGAEGRWAVLVERPDGARLVLVDARSGRVVGEIRVGE